MRFSWQFDDSAINIYGYGTTLPTREIKSLLGSLLLQVYDFPFFFPKYLDTMDPPSQTQIANAIAEL
jgi:hypothetical protein